VSVLGRVAGVSKVLASHRDEPYVRGRAAQVAGAALLADGLVGLENPVGKNSRSGILGGVVLLVIGFLVIGPANWLAEDLNAYADGELVVGTVESVTLPSGDGNTCSMIYAYEYAGQRYSRPTGYASSGLCRRVVGEPVEVSLDVADPARGRLITSGGGVAATWLPRAPFLLIALGAWTTLVRLVEIVVGIRLILWGRRTVRSSAATGNEEAILAELRAAWESSAGRPLPGGLAVLRGRSD
jgi:hypothetical protein